MYNWPLQFLKLNPNKTLSEMQVLVAFKPLPYLMLKPTKNGGSGKYIKKAKHCYGKSSLSKSTSHTV